VLKGLQFLMDCKSPYVGSIPARASTFDVADWLHVAGIAQLVERNLAKVEVASSNLVSRSILELKKPRR